ncbi:hypothetical protein UCMB321_2075 [Pseudomonas batumici]|uniref:Uncharacterized protein n=2 Tax=Pseudomonas batumici TaxID=226910 RepID=A0A0C2IAX3_9PSED|nr:hypothetical protein UCMB321_2075 [Pseudomonas batumici]
MRASPLSNAMTLFYSVQAALRTASDEVLSSLQRSKEQLQLMPRMQKTSEEKERASTLRPFEVEVQNAEQALQRIKDDGKWGQPLAWRNAAKVVKTAEKALEKQQLHVSSPVALENRMRRVEEHNSKADDRALKVDKLERDIADASTWIETGRRLRTQLDALGDTLLRDGWVHGDTLTVLDSLLQQLKRRDVNTAEQIAKNLIFQKKPSPDVITQWGQETGELLSIARAEGSVGFTALASFTPVVTSAVDLALRNCMPRVRSSVMQDREPADRWYHLAHQMTTPELFIHSVQWAFYWAGFQHAQEFSKDLSQASAHEEHSSGSFLKSFRSEFERWAGAKINAMGYPGVKSFFGTLALGGTTAEAHLGADFGIIVDIEVGGLVVRKVALLQGKVSNNGRADIGSEPSGPNKLTQLQKLNDPQQDFYVFYHRAQRHASFPWPTVTRASALVTPTTDLLAKSISVSTRESGWDWASFVAFGLCSATSGIGRLLGEHEDALAVLSKGDRNLLPSRLIFVTAGGGDRSLELRNRVKNHYSMEGTSYQRSMKAGGGSDMQMRMR